MKNIFSAILVVGFIATLGACSKNADQSGGLSGSGNSNTGSGQYAAGNPNTAAGPDTMASNTATSTSTSTSTNRASNDVMHERVGRNTENAPLHSTGTNTNTNAGSRARDEGSGF
jgi:hypothetical protein